MDERGKAEGEWAERERAEGKSKRPVGRERARRKARERAYAKGKREAKGMGKGNRQVGREAVGIRAHFLLEAAVLEVQGLDLLAQHSCNVALLTLCHHSSAGPGNTLSLWGYY